MKVQNFFQIIKKNKNNYLNIAHIMNYKYFYDESCLSDK